MPLSSKHLARRVFKSMPDVKDAKRIKELYGSAPQPFSHLPEGKRFILAKDVIALENHEVDSADICKKISPKQHTERTVNAVYAVAGRLEYFFVKRHILCFAIDEQEAQ